MKTQKIFLQFISLFLWIILFFISICSTKILAGSFSEAQKLYLSGQFLKAEKLFTESLSEETDESSAVKYKMLGICQYMQGKKKEAAKSFSQALSIAPSIKIVPEEVLDEEVIHFFEKLKKPSQSKFSFIDILPFGTGHFIRQEYGLGTASSLLQLAGLSLGIYYTIAAQKQTDELQNYVNTSVANLADLTDETEKSRKYDQIVAYQVAHQEEIDQKNQPLIYTGYSLFALTWAASALNLYFFSQKHPSLSLSHPGEVFLYSDLQKSITAQFIPSFKEYSLSMNYQF